MTTRRPGCSVARAHRGLAHARELGLQVAGNSSIVVEDQAELVEQRDERAHQTAEQPAAPSDPVAPPARSGPGSSERAQREYATRMAVEVADGATRDQVIAQLDRRGLA